MGLTPQASYLVHSLKVNQGKPRKPVSSPQEVEYCDTLNSEKKDRRMEMFFFCSLGCRMMDNRGGTP